ILGTLSGGEVIDKGVEGGDLDEAEQNLVRVEAEDPDLVGSVLDIDLGETNKFRKMKSALPVISTEESQSFFFSALMIVVSEIGDKTFFIAAIMAMKNPRFLVFSAAFAALILMSVLSAALGYAVPNLIPKIYTNYLAALLFLFFGIKMGFEGWQMTEEEATQELEEVSAELKEKEEAGLIEAAEAGGASNEPLQETFKEGLINLCQFIFSPVFVQTFVLSFFAEWGDRSQIATIALAASQVPEDYLNFPLFYPYSSR
ncbi:12713_t:CDS:2, partial [Acaulospora colombiana]